MFFHKKNMTIVVDPKYSNEIIQFVVIWIINYFIQ